MKNLEKFFYHSCAYCFVLSAVFYLFAALIGMNEVNMSFLRYITLFSFSMIISSAEFIFLIKKLPTYAKYAMHYLTLCVTFVLIFFTVRSTSGDYHFKASAVFAAVFIFSVAYFTVALFFNTVRRAAYKKTAPKKAYKSKFTNYDS